ncbi:type II toxin-antitoxin system VapC family toxin [Brevundimonas sp.]|uniref:type II toxin-antitoxin system VapC family toxin n=1 Tax=Brevundimonas sp. TaxID=1871086 RepID=UPI002ABB765D|nr:type II toxin-antitoxin system VapC family toxin [Brevundimonas sp.]MDZ4365346.1 type II toxin-antitoxin system VapC family toxin [Brevundimonas sp.]
MTVYLDASVCVSLFVSDVHTTRVRAWFLTAPEVVVSRWTMAEYSSALARLRRAAIITGAEHQAAELAFDQWMTILGPPISLTDMDMILARDLCREDGSIRTPDALHICVASRLDLRLASLDKDQLQVASRHGLSVIDL